MASARSMANEANWATPPTVRREIVRCTWPALSTMLHSELEPRPREQIGRVSATRDRKPENAGSLKPHYIAWYPFHVKRISRAGGLAGQRQLLHSQHYPEARNGLLQRWNGPQYVPYQSIHSLQDLYRRGPAQLMDLLPCVPELAPSQGTRERRQTCHKRPWCICFARRQRSMGHRKEAQEERGKRGMLAAGPLLPLK